jgi:hypothetical protein
MVGLAAVDQHTPLAVTADPPWEVTLPPEEAVVDVIEVGVVVVTAGTLKVPVTDTSSMQTPYPYLAFPSNAI